MIKATELRIGNYVFIPTKYGLETEQVEDIDTYEIGTTAQFETGNCSARIKQIEPIPLTEEWLLKFGFEESIMPFTGRHGYSKRNTISFIGFTSENEKGFRLSNPHLDLIIEHVHSLQNLYFALTGEELNIKE